MAKAEYCEECGRIIGIGCNCDKSFGDRVREQNTNWISWSDTRRK